MQDHVLQAFARKTGLSHDQAKQEIIRRFAAYATGKDFNLDRQFYATLTDMMQNPDTQQMKVTADFSFKENQKTNMRDLFDMNFLDFFKIMNQGDLQIVTVKNNNKNQ